MAKRKSVPIKIKRQIIKEAGNKCANPGCNNYRTHLHHIKEWATYETHDKDFMIAICPSCHDAVHYGNLKIDDETLLRWKKIKRKPTNRDHIYVEPGENPKLLLGSIALTGKKGLKVFKLAPHNELSFRLIDKEIFLVNLEITTLTERKLLKVVDNHIKYFIDDKIEYLNRPGKISIFAPLNPNFIPLWAIYKIKKSGINYGIKNKLLLLDIEVLEPGLVRIQGLWAEKDKIIVITDELLSFINSNRVEPFIIAGAGKDAVLDWHGPIDKSIFRIK
ncbi:HNH endonuclease signature motif containing protein [Halanaerobium sp. ST460_2HS_T2]|uniref:HNH endonuclease signature motif containing protein n=1 Tax=Halanaerobium sp. ST460_2HS_T2 TaxID=2183914 RepID=UPI000DF2B804|nr:HNH endonuclease signature motif containing protein [Halanaerobium sp. ST460_2HS_T2]RCW48145.1 HNH endonuclease [Halanaerobium sp. ST460_2HS_T2]